MDRSSASVYVYSKASALLAKSFIGKKAQQLFEVRNLQELWKLIFSEEVPLIPQTLLARQIEKKAENRFIKQYSRLLSCYDKPDDILIELLRTYDYQNLKFIGAALCSGDTEMPAIIDIGSYSMLHYDQWPSLEKITRNSPVSWYNEVPRWDTQKDFDRKLDKGYVRSLWKAVNKLSQSEIEPARSIVKEYIELMNCLWAMRLRVYYNMKSEEIFNWLAGAKDKIHSGDALASEAVKILSFSFDNYSDWEHWKYAYLLNPSVDAHWSLEPRWFEKSMMVKMHKVAFTTFHEQPFSSLVLMSWFRIKQNELNMIRTATEGLRLNISDAQMKEFAGI